jgi:hypothetical protein
MVYLWVVELLSPAWSSIGLGSRILTLFDCHPVGCCYFPVKVKIQDLGLRVWNYVRWIPTVRGLSGGLRKPVVDIIPKSKDRFMERPPMKIVQPWAYMGTTWCSMWQNLVWHINRWCGLSGLSWDPSGWEWVGKGVDSPENHLAQEGALGDLNWHLQWNFSGYVAN